jgi:hypothetical protein
MILTANTYMKESKKYPGFNVSADGTVVMRPNGLKATLTIEPRGYAQVTINDKQVYVHKLVADAFLPRPDNDDFEIIFKDGNKKNRYFKNLEYAYRNSNAKKLNIESNRTAAHIKSPFVRTEENAKISGAELVNVWNKRKEGRTLVSIARDYNVTEKSIRRALKAYERLNNITEE